MLTLQMLEDTDTILEDDWCRPLQLRAMSSYSDYYSFKNTYSGRPENNVEWCLVKDCMGAHWSGKTTGEFNSRIQDYQYEFVRGYIPRSHQLDMKAHNRS